MKKLTIKGAIAMTIVLPIMFALSIATFIFVYSIKLLFWISKVTGITDAFDYLSYIVKRKQKLNSFINALTDDDKITFKNG